MAGVKRRAGIPLSWSLVLAMAAASIVAIAEAQPVQESSSARMKYFLNLKRQGKQVEHLIRELNTLTEELKAKEADIRAKLPPEFIDPMAPLEKRARSPECYIAAGLSRSCDYKDLIAAVEERDFWNSVNSPGKRRRRGVETPNKSSISSRLDEVRSTDAKISKMDPASTSHQ
ncbi:uncharacterized protein LOC100906079 [Galendromus occidentalis]|uniref:Uncharacterized protein LOC100906079 n=1 Tax=Galendromus occidentalis TaxID=34638 RepID=A0AAJ6QVW4_9ACAR|nr:uncharacterized protein LOC100906079 [Galendromus occidentalis]